MPCFHPWKHKRYSDRPPVTLRCGQCIGCRLADSVDWSTRIAHEASLHKANCFITLTYRPEEYPEDWSVSVDVVQRFMKRLRKALGHGRVRYFACGEYGSDGGRAHYHLMLFGWEPTDMIPWEQTGSGHMLYRSAFLEKVWPHGFVKIGTVTNASAAYVARYCVKKVNGDRASEHYTRREYDGFGELIREWQVHPEFICMSTKPGIGLGWYEKFAGDAFPSDFVVIDGSKRPVPRYYLKKLKASETFRAALVGSEKVKAARSQRAALHADNQTPERLRVREQSQQLRAQRLKRELEES